MIDIKRNNLDKSLSPYLQQHKANPIWWQEWNLEIMNIAKTEQKPIFVSVGYATCHWCHVMASEAFSDIDTADYLNNNFICIKVDREQRPDIDQFLMHFITEQNGSGGWPLNVFLTTDIHPIFALTYAPAQTNNSMNSFLEITKKVYAYYKYHANDISPFIINEQQIQVVEEKAIIENILSYYDHENGGFGDKQKFPPHSTLLYLLYFLCIENNTNAMNMCITTLDAMRLRGLTDHLQGGIFRYCVDQKWTIPHFEKMLYDQAMCLWCYSLAYKIIKKPEYKIMAENILRSLDECFENNGLYVSAHDADTEHKEGATYIWNYDELEKTLLPDEFKQFCESYYIDKTGNFEGHIHLIKKNDADLSGIENKLLSIRKLRAQPEKDNKILCGINALVAIAMIQAGRYMEKPELEKKAEQIINRLLHLFWNGKKLGHSYFNETIQNANFLFDAAALLTAITMLYENNRTWNSIMIDIYSYVNSFKKNEKWLESNLDDFQPVYAVYFDHPIPSSISLAEMGLTRFDLLTGKDMQATPYQQPFQTDFFYIASMMNNGLFHIITSKELIPWNQIPPNSIQKYGEIKTDCYRGTCSSSK